MSKASVLNTVIQPKPPLPDAAFAPRLSSGLLEDDVWGNDPAELDAMLGVLVENVPVALAMFDCHLHYVLANRQWITDFGLQDALPLLGRSQFDVFPNLHPGWRSVYDRALQGHIVRSENDVTEGPDGQPMIFRWEVRPWRRREDSRVGGVMVTCEKFAFAGLPEPATPGTATAAAAKGEDPFETPLIPNAAAIAALAAAGGESSTSTGGSTSPAPAAAPAATPTAAQTSFVDCDLPMLLVDADGVILRGNDPAHRLLLARGLQEGVTQFWDVFGTDQTSARLRAETLEVIGRTLEGNGQSPASLKVRLPGKGAEQFMLWALSRSEPKDHLPQVLLVGVQGEDAPPPAPAPAAPLATLHSNTAAIEAAFLLERRHLEDQVANANTELRLLRDMEQAFKRRELRQREVLDTMPCGLIVLDERGRPTFHNAHLRDLFGHELKTGDAVEDWLLQACINDTHREEVSTIWRESVWRRQLTKVVSLSTADGLLKDFEFRPAPLPNNGLLLTIHDVTDTCRLEEMLRSTEAKFRTLLHEAPGAMVLTDATGSIFEVNPAAERLLGHPKAELRRTSIDDWLSVESVQTRREELTHLARGTQPHVSLAVVVRVGKEQEERPATLKLAGIYDTEGKLHSTAHFLDLAPVEAPPPATLLPAAPASPAAAPNAEAETDANADTDAARVAAAVAEEEAPVVTFEPGWKPLLQASSQGRLEQWSDEAEALFGWSEAEARQRWLHQLFSPSNATGFYSDLQIRLDLADNSLESVWYGKHGKGGPQRFQVRWAEDGDHVDLLVWDAQARKVVKMARPGPSHVFSVSPQITAWWPEADLDRERLMLTETHHRITNHLQLISSLLNLQSNAVDDESARQALRSSQNRVRAIAVLHQHLYSLAMGQMVPMHEFVSGLVDHLRQCFGVSEERVRVHLNLQDIRIRDEWVMPVALILNEAVSNSLKHAFPNDRSGEIHIELNLGESDAQLTVSDDGIGLPAGFEPADSLGLGLKVIGVFAEQMKGRISLKNIEDTGFLFDLHFPIACVDN